MRIISARQAWHDAFYKSANSTMASAIEQALSGVIGTRSNYRDTAGQMMHQAIAGRIQSAIARLPELHRRLGMMMYAPFDFVVAEDVEVVADWLADRCQVNFYEQGKPLSQRKAEQLPYLVRSYLTRHRALVTRQNDPLKSPRKICEHLADEFGIYIDTRNFTREYGRIINYLVKSIDDLDRDCLVPVSLVVQEFHDHFDLILKSEKEGKIVDLSGYWEECNAKVHRHCSNLARDLTWKPEELAL